MAAAVRCSPWEAQCALRDDVAPDPLDAAGASLQFRMSATAGLDPDTAAGGLTAASLLGVGGPLALPLFTLPAILGGSQVQPKTSRVRS